jgi:hypothetical protein
MPVHLESPMTFEQIFSLWVGKEKADAIFQRGAEIAYTEEDTEEDYESIRRIEYLLYIAADSGEIKTYFRHEWEGQWLFNEIPVQSIGAKHFSSTKIEVPNPFIFYIPPSQWPSHLRPPAERLHTYFNSNEVFARFPFLQPTPSDGPPKEEPGDNAEIKAQIQAWEKLFLTLTKKRSKQAAAIAIEKLKGKSHYKAYCDAEEKHRDIFSGLSNIPENISPFVAKLKTAIEKLARDNDLKMPVLDTRKTEETDDV